MFDASIYVPLATSVLTLVTAAVNNIHKISSILKKTLTC